MPYCKNCGAELPEDASFCPNCGAAVKLEVRLALAGWGERFVAWLIDVIILGVFLAWLSWPGFMLTPYVPRWVPFIDMGSRNIIYLLYWTLMEGICGQSIGKMVMKIKVTKLNGEPIDVGRALIESIGKAFLLPIDCIIGWIAFSDKKQRLFNRLSNTMVVKEVQVIA